MEILTPCFEGPKREAETESGTPKRENRTKASSLNTRDKEELSNRFQVLEVEDVSEEMNVTVDDALATLPPPPAKSWRKEVDIFEFEENLINDLVFVIFCFWEDLHNMREFIKDTWKGYAAGKFDSCTAALTTNVALGLVGNLEEELKIMLHFLDVPNPYVQLACFMQPIPGIWNVNTVPTDLQRVLGTWQHDEFPHRSTFVSLAKSIRGLRGVGTPAVLSIKYLYDAIHMPIPSEVKHEDGLLAQYLLEQIMSCRHREFGKELKEARRTGQLEQDEDFPYKFRPMAIVDELGKGLEEALSSFSVTVRNVFQA